jgi:hypothetical protein
VTTPPQHLAGWRLEDLGPMPPAWEIRDGAMLVQLASGRILMIGGWNHYDVWGPNFVPGVGGGDRVTNEVWASDDAGFTWKLILAHDPNAPTTGPTARFPPGHTLCVVPYNGHAVVFGNDPSSEIVQVSDVWQESNNGQTWTRIGTNAPTLIRELFMCGTYKGNIYVMGGQDSVENPATGDHDVWRSSDGGLTWTQLADAPWSPRGMVYRPTEHHGKMFIVSGGLYADAPYTEVAYNGVYSFDGSTWTTVLPDGHNQFTPSYYHNLASTGDRLWLVNGVDLATQDNLARVMYSDDDGKTWQQYQPGFGGGPAHAEAVMAWPDRILRISSNMDADEREIWQIIP